MFAVLALSNPELAYELAEFAASRTQESVALLAASNAACAVIFAVFAKEYPELAYEDAELAASLTHESVALLAAS